MNSRPKKLATNPSSETIIALRTENSDLSSRPVPKTNAAQASHLDRIGFALRSVTLVHARGMGESISHALREALFSMHSADRHLRSELRKSICNTTVAGGQSCRVWRTL
jgi:hypothetical protein